MKPIKNNINPAETGEQAILDLGDSVVPPGPTSNAVHSNELVPPPTGAALPGANQPFAFFAGLHGQKPIRLKFPPATGLERVAKVEDQNAGKTASWLAKYQAIRRAMNWPSVARARKSLKN